MLTKAQQETLKTIIGQHIEEAQQSVEELRELVKPIAPDVSLGRISRMDAINNKSINEDALMKTKKRLQKLENIHTDSKEFGLCVKCGNPIPYGRLEFMPEAKTCVQCAPRR